MQFSWFHSAVIVFLGAGLAFGLAPLIGSLLLAPRGWGGDLRLPYECGITPHGPGRVRFGINYYFYALLFIAFDVDVLYLFPVAAVFRETPGWEIFWALLVFVAILGLAVVYFWRKGVFTWPRKLPL